MSILFSVAFFEVLRKYYSSVKTFLPWIMLGTYFHCNTTDTAI